MTSGDITPEMRELIRAHARQIAATAPRPTDEQIAVLRRWFGTRARQRARRNVA